jgi:hypothetical protein
MKGEKQMAEKNSETELAELMATYGSQMLATVLNKIEGVRQQKLKELAELDVQITAKQERIPLLEAQEQSIANAIAERGALLVRLSLKIRRYVLGETNPQGPWPTEKFDAMEAWLDERIAAQQEQAA